MEGWAVAVQDHWLNSAIRGSYFNLRIAIALVGLAVPLVMVVGGLAAGGGVERSLSAYYHTPLRDLFVGLLFLLAAPLYLYKGYSKPENLALNISALGAVMVAVFPIDTSGTTPLLHAIGAFAFFLGGAFVCWFCARDTLVHLPDAVAARYRRAYRCFAVLMALCPATALLLTLAGPWQGYWTLVVEVLGTVTLAAYWLVKTQEIRLILASTPKALLA